MSGEIQYCCLSGSCSCGSPDRSDELREAEPTLTWDIMANAAHSIKGAANMVGESELATLAAAIESQSKQRHVDQLADLIHQLHHKATEVGS